VYAPLSKTNTSLLIAMSHFLQFNYRFLPAIYLIKQHNIHTQHGQSSDITGSSSAWLDVKIGQTGQNHRILLFLFLSWKFLGLWLDVKMVKSIASFFSFIFCPGNV
jgi:hypothetical protein